MTMMRWEWNGNDMGLEITWNGDTDADRDTHGDAGVGNSCLKGGQLTGAFCSPIMKAAPVALHQAAHPQHHPHLRDPQSHPW